MTLEPSIKVTWQPSEIWNVLFVVRTAHDKQKLLKYLVWFSSLIVALRKSSTLKHEVLHGKKNQWDNTLYTFYWRITILYVLKIFTFSIHSYFFFYVTVLKNAVSDVCFIPVKNVFVLSFSFLSSRHILCLQKFLSSCFCSRRVRCTQTESFFLRSLIVALQYFPPKMLIDNSFFPTFTTLSLYYHEILHNSHSTVASDLKFVDSVSDIAR